MPADLLLKTCQALRGAVSSVSRTLLSLRNQGHHEEFVLGKQGSAYELGSIAKSGRVQHGSVFATDDKRVGLLLDVSRESGSKPVEVRLVHHLGKQRFDAVACLCCRPFPHAHYSQGVRQNHMRAMQITGIGVCECLSNVDR